MGVMKRQDIENPILTRPAPGLHQALDLGLQVGMSQQYALGAAGGSAGIEDQGFR